MANLDDLATEEKELFDVCLALSEDHSRLEKIEEVARKVVYQNDIGDLRENHMQELKDSVNVK